jgi:hypothetical protein
MDLIAQSYLIEEHEPWKICTARSLLLGFVSLTNKQGRWSVLQRKVLAHMHSNQRLWLRVGQTD